MSEHRTAPIGIQIDPVDIARLSGAQIAAIARRLDGVVDFWVLDTSNDTVVGPEPTVAATFAARATSQLGVVVAASTHRDHPYNLARRLVSLDHASGGRAGWLPLDEAPGLALSQSSDGLPIDSWTESPLGPDLTESAVAAIRDLWASWPLDSIVADHSSGVFVDTDRVRAADTSGTYRIAGPLPLPGPPQVAIPVLGSRVTHSTAAAPDVLITSSDAPLVETFDGPSVRSLTHDQWTQLASDGSEGTLVQTPLDALDGVLAQIAATSSAPDSPRRTLRDILGLPTLAAPTPRGRQVFATTTSGRQY